jgi:UDP-MurNAc hydroxylase
MQIEFISNAGIIIRLLDGRSILVDPWLYPAYHGSWHNFPPLSAAGREKYLSLQPDYIHISHLHPDHLDPRSLAHYPKETPVIIGKLPYPHLENRLRGLGYINIVSLELNQPQSFADIEINIWGDFHEMVDEPEDLVAYSMDTSLWITDRDRTSVFHVNDNVLTVEVAKQIVETQGHPDIAIVPYSGASMYPHAFTNYTTAEKLEQKERLRLRCLHNLFLGVAEILKPQYLIPAAGSYVMGGELTEYNRYLHQSTPAQVQDFWQEHAKVESEVFFLQEGDTLDTKMGSVQINPAAPLRNFSETDRERYGATLATAKLDHESIVIPDSFEVPWGRLLFKARRNLWFKQQQINVLPPTDIELRLTDGQALVCTFSFSLDRELPHKQPFEPVPDRHHIIFTIDAKLMMMNLLSATIWNNLEIGALIEVHRTPDVYDPTAHSLMSYFVL